MLKLGVNLRGWEYLQVLLISKKEMSSLQSRPPFYLLRTVTSPGLSASSFLPLIRISKAGTLLVNCALKN